MVQVRTLDSNPFGDWRESMTETGEDPRRTLLAALEAYRRKNDFSATDIHAASLMVLVRGDSSQAALALRARVYYEWHMARYQEAMMECHDTVRSGLLQESFHFAEISADWARRANDEAGALYADMNIGGLIYVAMECWDGALELSCDVKQFAEQLATTARDPRERERCERIVVNALLHQLNMQRLHFRNTAIMKKILRELKNNEFFNAHRDEYLEALEDAQAFLAGSSR